MRRIVLIRLAKRTSADIARGNTHTMQGYTDGVASDTVGAARGTPMQLLDVFLI